MEDYELVKLVHKLFPSSNGFPSCGVFMLKEKVQTSVRRWKQKGLIYTTLMNQVQSPHPLLSLNDYGRLCCLGELLVFLITCLCNGTTRIHPDNSPSPQVLWAKRQQLVNKGGL
jgi:hypothetical protein